MVYRWEGPGTKHLYVQNESSETSDKLQRHRCAKVYNSTEREMGHPVGQINQSISWLKIDDGIERWLNSSHRGSGLDSQQA